MLDLGIVPGTTIVPIFISPFGDPKAFEVRGTLLAIRNKDASKIVVNN